MDPIVYQGDGEKRTQFYIREQAAQTAAQTPTVSATDHQLILAGAQILLVEDEPDVCDFLTMALQQFGAKVRAAASAAEALEILTQWKPDLLVSDICMPVEDGYALIQKVRALGPEQGGQIPAVALTAYTRLEDRRRALSAGYHMHLPKTVSPLELATIMADLMGRPTKGRV